jgi:hypothetical protein
MVSDKGAKLSGKGSNSSFCKACEGLNFSEDIFKPQLPADLLQDYEQLSR